MKTYGEWSYNSPILKLNTRWRWLVSFTPMLIYPVRNEFTVPIAYQAGWDIEVDWTLWKENSLFSLPEIELMSYSP
jgi:hypothetical protein